MEIDAKYIEICGNVRKCGDGDIWISKEIYGNHRNLLKSTGDRGNPWRPPLIDYNNLHNRDIMGPPTGGGVSGSLRYIIGTRMADGI